MRRAGRRPSSGKQIVGLELYYCVKQDQGLLTKELVA